MTAGKSLSQKKKKVSSAAIAAALISLIFCIFIITATIADRTDVINMGLEQQIFERAHRINEAITKLLFKTHALSALITLDGGNSFDIVAPAIVDDPSIKNIFIAPNGIVTKVFPHTEDDSIIGINIFSDNAFKKEALLARELGDLVLGGPFETAQGGQVLAGRMPVYIDTPGQDNVFWGIVSVTLNFPQVLEHAELDIFETHGYSYQLWRINPYNNEKQVIVSGSRIIKPNSHYIERSIFLLNAEWKLRVWPVRMWYNYPENIALILAGICISGIVFFIMQNNYELKNMQSVFEQMAITDPLTGIFNRRHFMDIARIEIEKARRHNDICYFIMLDIDKFKLVNDTYGHQIGDKVLIDIAARIKAAIRPYDLFARYGGEEFIILTTGISKNEVIDMTERLRLTLCSNKYEYDSISIESSASFGISQIKEYSINNAIKYADDALYAAKGHGRNCVIFYERSSQSDSQLMLNNEIF